jgi:hypothetical protein
METAGKEIASKLLENRNNGISFAQILNEFPRCERLKHAQNFIDSIQGTSYESLYSSSWQEKYDGKIEVGLRKRDFAQNIWSMELQKDECQKK